MPAQPQRNSPASSALSCVQIVVRVAPVQQVAHVRVHQPAPCIDEQVERIGLAKMAGPPERQCARRSRPAERRWSAGTPCPTGWPRRRGRPPAGRGLLAPDPRRPPRTPRPRPGPPPAARRRASRRASRGPDAAKATAAAPLAGAAAEWRTPAVQGLPRRRTFLAPHTVRRRSASRGRRPTAGSRRSADARRVQPLRPFRWRPAGRGPAPRRRTSRRRPPTELARSPAGGFPASKASRFDGRPGIASPTG